MSEIRTIVRSRSRDPQNKSQNRSPQGNSQLIAPFLMTLLAPLTSCTNDSLHRTTHLITERPRIVSSVLQSVADESDFFLAAEANSSLLCTLIEIEEDASSGTSDALLLPSVAEIAGRLNPTTGVLSPLPDLSVLSLDGDGRYDCRRCSDATFDRTLRRMQEKHLLNFSHGRH